MIGQKKIVAVIAARGGSKGVLRKNVRLVDKSFVVRKS